MHRTLLLLIASACFVPASPLLGLPLQSNHDKLRAVPAPRPVVIDGTLEEWDTSGEMLVYAVRRIRDRFGVRVSAQWDREALYLALAWRDPTPMINNVDPDRAPAEGWMADAMQGRFVTDYSQIHLTAWYSSKHDKSVAQFNYDGPMNPGGQRLFRTSGTAIRDRSGFQLAFQKGADGRGYVQEMRIPWTLLFRKPAPAAGLRFRFTGEYYWGGPSATKWPAVTWADPMNPAFPQRIVIYQNPGAWGEIELLGQGNLPQQPSEDFDQLLQGPVLIRVEVPKDAVKFSLAIDDAAGRRVRNLASHANVIDYSVKTGKATRTIDVPWDGRADGTWDKDRSLFLGDVLPPGLYTARVLVHSGIGVVHAGSFYNPGTPPWHTPDGTGGWGSDHSIFSAVAAMPVSSTSKGRVFLGSHGGECGVGFIGLNADGRKIWEWVRLGSGARAIAASDKFVYFCYQDVTGAFALGRVTPDKGEELAFSGGKANVQLPAEPGGLAVGKGIVATSLPGANKVLLLDAESGATVREIAVPAPGSLAFTPSGRLVGATGGRQLFSLPDGAAAPTTFALPGVTELKTITIDAAGALYVSDGKESNVKAFARAEPQARLVRTIGQPGGHRPGPWNAQRMAAPIALAVQPTVDGKKRLWACEANYRPRRVSVWAEDSALVRDYIGNTGYMGTGGLLSDDLPGLGIVDGVMFRLNLKDYAYTPLELMVAQPDPAAGRSSAFAVGQNYKAGGSFGGGYHFLSKASGQEREYYVEAANAASMVFMRRQGRWLCVAALGPAQFAKDLPSKAPGPNCIFSWSDLDGDGLQSPGEIQWFDVGGPNVLNGGWGYRCGKDLAFYHSGWAFRPVRIAADGAPVYDVTKAQRLPGEAAQAQGDLYKTRFGFVGSQPKPGYKEPHGVIHGLHEITGYDEQGRRRWSYPNYWLSVHGAMSAPMAMPGVIMGMLKFNGVVPCGDREMIVIRGNTGQDFLIRDDGLYVGELWTDQRMAPSALPNEMNILGVPINDTSLGGECFNGMVARQQDGRVRTTYGVTDVRIAELTGLDRVRDLPPQTVVLSPEQAAVCRGFQPRKGGESHKTSYDVAQGNELPLDARLFEQGAIAIRAGREEVGRAVLRYDRKNLYVAWLVFDSTPLANRGNSPALAFKTGDSLNLYIAQEDAVSGGTRVLLTLLGGDPVAIVYKPLGPGNKPLVFESPVRKSPFAYVSEEPAVRFAHREADGQYILSAAIPWSVLGIEPKAGLKLRGDLGILFGDDTGSATAQRVQWVDRDTNVVNDVPTEAEFSPVRWGTLLLK